MYKKLLAFMLVPNTIVCMAMNYQAPHREMAALKLTQLAALANTSTTTTTTTTSSLLLPNQSQDGLGTFVEFESSKLNTKDTEEQTITSTIAATSNLATRKPANNRRKHKCNECDKVYYDKRNLILHIAKNHYSDNISKTVKNHVSQCPICDEFFVNEAALLAHGDVKHLNITYDCDECSASFTKKDSLDLHIQNCHENVILEQYQCQHCSRSFDEEKKLKHHMIKEHTQKKFECTQCSKKFTTKGILKSHIDSIHKDIRFECDQCHKSYPYFKSLQRHINADHLNVRYKCEICNSEFTQMAAVNRHIKKFHP